MKRNVLNSPRLLELKKERRRIFQNKIFLGLLLFLAIFIGLIYLSRLPVLNISLIEVAGNKIIDAEAIKASVKKGMAGNYLWFFPKSNVFFYPQNNIKKELQSRERRLKDINLAIKDKQTLAVSVTERTALYTWCGAVLPEAEENNQKCYFLDRDGYIFDEAPYFSGEVYFKFYGASSGPYFAAGIFQKLTSFKETLENMKLKPAGLHIGENGDIKMFLSGRTPLFRPEIIFKTDADLETMTENLETALSTEPLQSNFKNKYSSLLYIDLRFGNKVYYKFK